MIDMEGTHDNDDEEFSFVSIAAATANVTRYLRLDKKKDEERSEQQKPGNAAKDRVTNERALIEHRLRELAEWERRIREDRLRYKKWK